ncbi:MAG: CDP-diacylglycerol--serine O-phosphatidyltransferase [Rhodobacteraceae bacterium]|nr:CDP-diacylglycerol--serine O-phosphatidyltransferase [Paracoccaceae bacterium]
MSHPPNDTKAEVSILQLLPNVITIGAICAGLTAIRFGYQGDFETSVRLILLAAVLDGIDGRLARMMNTDSAVGAELDSLADFLNFGVAPALILHHWALTDTTGLGWIAVLCYTICCVLRLARFNVTSRLEKLSPDPGSGTDHFIGVPSPAGAMLVMLPMFVVFLFPDIGTIPPVAIAIYIGVIGLLMISRLPTYSFKNISIARKYAKYLMLMAVLMAAALFTYLWATLVLFCVIYLLGLVRAFQLDRRAKKNTEG